LKTIVALPIHAQRIRERRLALHMSQEELAEAMQTVQATISRYERGENDPTADSLAALARALRTSSDWLLGLSESLSLPAQTKADLSDLERIVVEALRSSTVAKQQVIANIITEITKIST
jgi:transcriptional regulator with XRE-family HTH domain